MPFKSEAQKRFMFANQPEVAKRWAEKYGSQGDLPERVAPKRKKSSILDAWRRTPDRFSRR
jgi:hypothetical protein